ncbi:DNA-directed RNA polymerase subunit A'', partial [Candidatus Bathyarchaeota archaeon]
VRGERDPLKGVVENVIVGQTIPIGTGLVDIYMSATPITEKSEKG